MMTDRWSQQKANDWYHKQPWLVGCNFTPSTAINQLEMWQEGTFDPQTIDHELGWASSLGFNTVRVYLHDLLWEADADGFQKRIDRYLAIAFGHGIRTAFVFFDDCWNDEPKLGKQPNPLPGVHNSGWMQSPGRKIVNDSSQWGRLERYVKGVVERFSTDERVIFWDLYNEPGNNLQGTNSLPLLQKAFEWARGAGPSQPLSVGIWFDLQEMNNFQLAASDIITFHNYNDTENLRTQIQDLKKHGRPLVCTEYMARGRDSKFQTHLPVFKSEQVGCLNWGLVSGKTQTIYPWGSPGGGPEPDPWFHDIFRKDGSSYDPDEVAFIQKITGV